MSLVGTLGRMAVGVMVAKGVGKMMNNRHARGAPTGAGGGLGGMLGGLLGGQGGASGGARGTGGGLAGGLGSLLGGGSGGRSGGGLGDLGAMLGGRSPAGGAAAGGALAGGLGGLLEKIGGGGGRAPSGASGASGASPSGGSFGDLLNSSLAGDRVDHGQVDPGQEEHARLLIRAMVNAAKSDGQIDEQERERLVEHMGDEATAEDREFVLSEMRAPLDVEGFIKSVPRGAEREVYTMSLMAIDLDEQAEARYLDTLRKGMNLSEADVNSIHEQLGVPALYS